MNHVVSTKAFGHGEVSSARHELIRHGHDMEIADQCLEFRDCSAMLRHGETATP